MQILFKKNYFFIIFQLLLIFFMYIITSVISSAKIACDVLFEQICKRCFAFKANLNIKELIQNFKVHFNEKLISNCIIFEENKYIYRSCYLGGCWLLK